MPPEVADCLKMKKVLDFNSNVHIRKGNSLIGKNKSIVTLPIWYKNKEKIIHEEILVYDQSGFVYQLGGVISLFLGFSFFGIICDILENIEKNI